MAALEIDIHGPMATELADEVSRLGRGQVPPGWDVVASSPHARVRRHAERGIYCKEFLPRSRFDVLKSWLRGDRSIRARTRAEALEDAGFETPKALAWGLYARHRGFLVTCLLYTSPSPRD